MSQAPVQISFLPRGAQKGVPLIEVHMRALGVPAPVKELRFAAETLGKQWRFDYAWPDLKVALEIEGATFSRAGGRHNRGVGYRNDVFKYNRAAIFGWLVVRATTEMVTSGDAIAELLDALRVRGVDITAQR